MYGSDLLPFEIVEITIPSSNDVERFKEDDLFLENGAADYWLKSSCYVDSNGIVCSAKPTDMFALRPVLKLKNCSLSIGSSFYYDELEYEMVFSNYALCKSVLYDRVIYDFFETDWEHSSLKELLDDIFFSKPVNIKNGVWIAVNDYSFYVKYKKKRLISALVNSDWQSGKYVHAKRCFDEDRGIKYYSYIPNSENIGQFDIYKVDEHNIEYVQERMRCCLKD